MTETAAGSDRPTPHPDCSTGDRPHGPHSWRPIGVLDVRPGFMDRPVKVIGEKPEAWCPGNLPGLHPDCPRRYSPRPHGRHSWDQWVMVEGDPSTRGVVRAECPGNRPEPLKIDLPSGGGGPAPADGDDADTARLLRTAVRLGSADTLAVVDRELVKHQVPAPIRAAVRDAVYAALPDAGDDAPERPWPHCDVEEPHEGHEYSTGEAGDLSVECPGHDAPELVEDEDGAPYPEHVQVALATAKQVMRGLPEKHLEYREPDSYYEGMTPLLAEVLLEVLPEEAPEWTGFPPRRRGTPETPE